MQHSPRFLNYTTDRVRRHQRLTVAEESISPARSDQQRRRNTGAARQAKPRAISARPGSAGLRPWPAADRPALCQPSDHGLDRPRSRVACGMSGIV